MCHSWRVSSYYQQTHHEQMAASSSLESSTSNSKWLLEMQMSSVPIALGGLTNPKQYPSQQYGNCGSWETSTALPIVNHLTHNQQKSRQGISASPVNRKSTLAIALNSFNTRYNSLLSSWYPMPWARFIVVAKPPSHSTIRRFLVSTRWNTPFQYLISVL